MGEQVVIIKKDAREEIWSDIVDCEYLLFKLKSAVRSATPISKEGFVSLRDTKNKLINRIDRAYDKMKDKENLIRKEMPIDFKSFDTNPF